jgi:hypothetical protein
MSSKAKVLLDTKECLDRDCLHGHSQEHEFMNWGINQSINRPNAKQIRRRPSCAPPHLHPYGSTLLKCECISYWTRSWASGTVGNSPETPARVRRLATPLAAVDLAIQALDAVVISQVETLVGVLVLDFEFYAQDLAGRRGTHALCLARRIVSSEHAATLPACVIDPSLGLLFVLQSPARNKASSHRNFCVDGSDHSNSDSGGDLHGGSCNREQTLK